MPVGVLDPDRPALDPLNAIGRVAELEDVARHALDGEILVDGADDLILRLEQDLVVGGVGNRAAGGERGRSRAAPATQDVIDPVAMNERATPAPARGEAFGQHADDGIEVATRELAERPGAPQAVVERRLPANPAPRPRPRSAGPARRAAGRGLTADQAPRDERCRAGPRIRRGRRARAETVGPWACRRPRGRSVRRAAESSRSSAASRSGRRGRRRRCRCRVRARQSRPAPSVRRA